jgi:hypothetical protein
VYALVHFEPPDRHKRRKGGENSRDNDGTEAIRQLSIKPKLDGGGSLVLFATR